MDIQEIEGDAEVRIRKHRMGDFRLRVVDAAGAPLPGARLNLRLVRHDFRLAANGFLIRTLSDETLLGEYARAFAGLLNYATLPFYTILFSHPAVDVVTWWDFSDRHAWQRAPAGLIRHDMSPKPLAEWLANAFGETWSTRAEITTDANGMAVFRGFFGAYAVRAETASGAGLAGSFRMCRLGAREAGVELK